MKILNYEGLRYTLELMDKHIKEICDRNTDVQKAYEEISKKISSVSENFKGIMVAEGETGEESFINITSDQIVRK